MSTPIERALAELRAVPMREAAPKPEAEAAVCPFGCTGDRRGYQWHQRNRKLPACPAAHEANRTYTSEYLREWRRRNPDYARKWRAKQQTKSGEDK